ncbi:MAG: type II CAAX endopeptidase family protein [Acidobacteriota bacterium]|jgi:hypothetical protein
MDEERHDDETRDPSAGTPLVHPLTRVGLYLLAFLILQILVGLPALMIWAVLSGLGPAILVDGEIPVSALLFVFVCLAPVMVSATLIFLRTLDRRPLRSIGVRWPADGAAGVAREAAWGAGAALGLLGLWIVVAAVPAELRFDGLSESFGFDPATGPAWIPAWLSGTGGGLVVLALYCLGFLIQSGLEEWVFRGYVYRALRERWSWATVAGATSLVFSVLHMRNPGIEPAGLVNTFLLGIVFSAAVEATGSLWPVMAGHGAWNFAMASVLGVPMSGVRVNGMLDFAVDGPGWATGAAYGPEGSWLMTALLVLAAAGMARWVDSREDGSQRPTGASSDPAR